MNKKFPFALKLLINLETFCKRIEKIKNFQIRIGNCCDGGFNIEFGYEAIYQ
jgi:hypothetical protein